MRLGVWLSRFGLQSAPLAARARSGISGRRRNSVVRNGNFVSVPKFHFCHVVFSYQHQNRLSLLNSQVRKPGFVEFETIPLPSNLTSICAMAVEDTMLLVVISTCLITPRIVMDWCSRLI